MFRTAFMGGAAVAAVALGVAPAPAQARSCDFNLPGVSRESVTGATCAKGKTVARAFRAKRSCWSGSATTRCTVARYSCTARNVNPSGSTIWRASCKRGAARVKFDLGFG